GTRGRREPDLFDALIEACRSHGVIRLEHTVFGRHRIARGLLGGRHCFGLGLVRLTLGAGTEGGGGRGSFHALGSGCSRASVTRCTGSIPHQTLRCSGPWAEDALTRARCGAPSCPAPRPAPAKPPTRSETPPAK